MASTKQFAFIVLLSLVFGASGALGGITEGAVGMATGGLGGIMAGGLVGFVLVAFYNSRTDDEVLTVEDVQ